MQEVFGALIVVGAALFFGVRFFLRRKEKDKEDMEDMRVSTEKLKEELGKSADTVIERMGIHVKHLEKLLAEADAKNAELTNRLRKSRQERLEMEELCDRAALLLKKEQQQREAQAAVPAPPPVYVQTETVEAAPTYQDPAAYAAAGYSAPVEAQEAPIPQAQELPVQPTCQTSEPSGQESAQQTLPDTSTMERQDAIDFATVLQESIDRDAQEANEAAAYLPQEPVGEPSPELAYSEEPSAQPVQQPLEQEAQPEKASEPEYIVVPEEAAAPAETAVAEPEEPAISPEEASSTDESEVEPEDTPEGAGEAEEIEKSAEAEEDKPPAEATVADKARALLLSGESIEEVSRETGMGMGALELLREMSRRELEKKK